MKFLKFVRYTFDVPELSAQVRPQFLSAIFETAQSSAFRVYPTNPHVCVTQKKLFTKHYVYYCFISSKIWKSEISAMHFRCSRTVRTSKTSKRCFWVPYLKPPSRVLSEYTHKPPRMCHAEELIHETLFILLFYKFENMIFLKFLRCIFDVPELSAQVRPQFLSVIFETS